jgi:hypothetical protein
MSSTSVSGSIDLKFLEEWKPSIFYEKNSILKNSNKLYKVLTSHNASHDIQVDILAGILSRIDSSVPQDVGVVVGPQYLRSGNSRTPTVSGGWATSSNPADIIWKVVITASGSGDYPDGGYPWTAYLCTVYFKRLGG